MLTCPFCKAELGDDARRSGRCAACGGRLAAETVSGDAMGTVADLYATLAAEQPDIVTPTAAGHPRRRSPETLQQVTATWQEVGSRETNSLMTIKVDCSVSDVSESSLTVHERVLREPAEVIEQGTDYQLLEVIGRGGMGVVYAARQASVDRTVAVKMLKAERTAGVDKNKFMSEAVVTGDLDHPNIVPIYELGNNEHGDLFYSMKRVQGLPWDEEIRRKTQAENVEILMKVADAVAFSHARGVIHRDLKPANVMLGEFGEVLVMDWGLALPTEGFSHHALVSATVTMGGTPAYMAPEMATGPLEEIGPSSDIYLLGAILYEIVTGGPPHGGKNVMECLHAAAENEILPTTESGELLNIALSAMATDPADRYSSVQEFQTAIREYQAHSESTVLSIRAEQELQHASQSDEYQDYARALFGFQEALALWEKNSQAAAGLSTAKRSYAASAMRKGDYDLGISLLDSDDPAHEDLLEELRAAQQERDARQQRLKSVKRTAAALVVMIFIVITVAFFWIRRARDRAVEAEGIAIEQRQQAVEAQDRERMAKQAALEAKDAALKAEARERVAKQAALAARDEAVEAKDQEELAKQAAVAAKEIADQKRQEAEVAQAKERLARQAEAYEAYLAQIGLAAAKTQENAFDDAYRLLEAYGDSPLRHWEWGRLKYLCRQSVKTFAADGPIDSLAVATDGSRFVTGSRDGMARIWNLQSDEPLFSIPHDGQYVYAVAFSPNGRYVVTGSSDGKVRIFSADDGVLVNTLDAHTDSVLSVAFSPDGRWLLTTSRDKTARLWNIEQIETARLIRVLRGHRRSVWSAAFSPDMKRIVTTGQDGKAVLWSIDAAAGGHNINITEQAAFTGHDGPVLDAVFSPDCSRVATAGYDHRVLVWDPLQVRSVDLKKIVSGKPVAPPVFQAFDGHTAAVHSVRYSPDGKFLLSGSDDNTVKLWDVASGRLIKTLRGHSSWVRSCAFVPPAPFPGGRYILTGSHDHQAKLWSIASYEEVRVLEGRVMKGHTDAVLSAAFDPSGQRVITASRDHTARIWDVASGETVRELTEGHEFLASRAIFFPDGKKLVTSAMDNTARIWDVLTGTQIRVLPGTGRTATVALSHDGRWILTGSDRSSAEKTWNAKLFNAETGQLVQTLRGRDRRVTAVAFSPDDRLLLTGDEGGLCRLWSRNGPSGVWTEHRRLAGHSRKITAAAFLPDGRRVLTASTDNTVGQWDTETGQEKLSLVLKHPDSVSSMALSPDGRYVLTTCIDRIVRLWDVDRAQPIALLDAVGGKSSLAANVRHHLTRFRLTPGELAQQSGLGQARITDILGALAEIDPASVESLAHALHVDARALLTPMFSSVAFSPDGHRALAASPEDRTVHVWQLPATNDGPPKREGRAEPERLQSSIALDLARHGGQLWAAIFSPDGVDLLTIGGNEARLFNATTAHETMSFSPHGAVASANFSPDGRRVVTGSWDRSVKIWNVENGRAILKLVGGHTGAVNTAVFSTDAQGSNVLTASDDGTAKLWDATTGEVLLTFAGHQGPVRSAVFSADGRRVLTASDDATARVWDSRTGEELFALVGHQAAVLCATFSRDGKWAITGSEDKTARIWNLQTHAEKKPASPLRGHTASITSVAFSPDGRRVITGSRDGTAKLWDSQTGREVLTLAGHSADVTSVAFSPNGQYVLTGSRDGTAVVWLAADWKN